MRPLESTTLLGKEHGELSTKHMVCGVTCTRKFDTPRKQFFKKQQGIIDRLYFDIMQTNVRVGDTVRVLGDITNGRCVEAFGWGRVKHIRFDWPSGCAEISVKVLDTTVLVWPAGERRIDAKENEGRPLRQRSGCLDLLAERSSNTAFFERLTVKCNSQSKRALRPRMRPRRARWLSWRSPSRGPSRERARGRRSWCVSIVTEAAAQKAARKRPDEEARSRRRRHRRRTLAEEKSTSHCHPGSDRNIPPPPSGPPS